MWGTWSDNEHGGERIDWMGTATTRVDLLKDQVIATRSDRVSVQLNLHTDPPITLSMTPNCQASYRFPGTLIV